MSGKNLFASCASLAAATILLGGCGSEDAPPAPGPTTGFVSVALTDAPVDSALRVCIEFQSVEFKHADDAVENQLVIFESPVQVNLLAYQGTESVPLLLGEEMQAGQYNWIRLAVNAPRGAETLVDDGDAVSECVAGGSYIKLENGEVHNLYVPSSDATGLKLNQGFVLPPGGSMSFTIDFDLRKSITAPPGQDPDYKLRPTLRMVDNGAVGTLQGSVDPSLVPDGCIPVVYVFAGDVTPDDYDGDDGDPLTSAMVKTEDEGMSYGYSVGFLAAGTYTAAFTCDADETGVEDVLAFEPVDGVTFDIVEDEMKVVSFPPDSP